MAFNWFKKSAFGGKKDTAKPEPVQDAGAQVATKSSAPVVLSQGAHAVIRNFYVSEKASRLMGASQYVFKIAPEATAPEVRKHVAALYKVKVVRVQVLKAPKKSRNVGKHHGFRSGFKKAIVTLAPGQVIAQARP